MNCIPVRLLCTCIAIVAVARGIPAPAEPPTDDTTGLVWIAGTITGVHAGQAEFDLGDVHGLTFGQSVAVFRRRDDHFEPVGVLEIDSTGSTTSVARKSRSVIAQTGDLVLTCRTLQQLGPSDDFRDAFLKRQLVTRGDRNRYSNFLEGREAETLHRYARKQPKWFRESAAVAGTIHSSSIDKGQIAGLQPLLSQILLTQEFALDGVQVRDALSFEWNWVLAALDVRNKDLFASVTVGTEPAAGASPAAADAPGTAPSAVDALEAPVPVEAIRRHINERMFSSPREQRQLAVLLAVAMEHQQPRYEDVWLTQQLEKSQFPGLVDEAEWLREFASAMTRVRQEQK